MGPGYSTGYMYMDRSSIYMYNIVIDYKLDHLELI
jgi:hypothetical protein